MRRRTVWWLAAYGRGSSIFGQGWTGSGWVDTSWTTVEQPKYFSTRKDAEEARAGLAAVDSVFVHSGRRCVPEDKSFWYVVQENGSGIYGMTDLNGVVSLFASGPVADWYGQLAQYSTKHRAASRANRLNQRQQFKHCNKFRAASQEEIDQLRVTAALTGA